MKTIREEIARSHQTVDNDPVQYDDNENVKVEMYANDMGTWSVKVDCVSDPSLSHPLQKFPDEGSAHHYARQACDRIIRQTMNKNENLIRQMVRSILIESLQDDLANVTTGREAKQMFAKYVDQSEFEKGTLVHWVGSTSNLKKILENARTKDELSCNFYPEGGFRDWMARGPKKPIGVIVQGHVTYAGKENMFTGYAKRPRKKADKIWNSIPAGQPKKKIVEEALGVGRWPDKNGNMITYILKSNKDRKENFQRQPLKTRTKNQKNFVNTRKNNLNAVNDIVPDSDLKAGKTLQKSIQNSKLTQII